MTPEQKKQRYERIAAQLKDFFKITPDPISRMATAAALLSHKMDHFYWVGFYRLIDGQLLVGPYQGSLACQKLAANTGVCWACVQIGQGLVVPDVRQFAGHIACDARSRSEVVVPCLDKEGHIAAVLDADSDKVLAFDTLDAEGLLLIADMIYAA